jgi:nucleoside-diphosphate-sugar epimerase
MGSGAGQPAPGPDTRIVGSVGDRKAVDRAFADHGIEAVVHAGALLKPDIVRVPASAFIDTNVTGTLERPLRLHPPLRW